MEGELYNGDAIEESYKRMLMDFECKEYGRKLREEIELERELRSVNHFHTFDRDYMCECGAEEMSYLVEKAEGGYGSRMTQCPLMNDMEKRGKFLKDRQERKEWADKYRNNYGR